jgi:hypothetical protein
VRTIGGYEAPMCRSSSRFDDWPRVRLWRRIAFSPTTGDGLNPDKGPEPGRGRHLTLNGHSQMTTRQWMAKQRWRSFGDHVGNFSAT